LETAVSENDKYGSITVKLGSYNLVGHVGHKITYNTPPTRNLDSPVWDEFKTAVLAQYAKGEIKVGSVLGDHEAHQLAEQIEQFMVANGYTVLRHVIMLAPPPQPGVLLQPDGILVSNRPMPLGA
jgi:hypothetical protein